MPDQPERISTREFLEHKIDALREHIDHKFKALDDRLGQLDDHEARIRAMEKVAPIKIVAQAVIGIVAVAAAALGLKQP